MLLLFFGMYVTGIKFNVWKFFLKNWCAYNVCFTVIPLCLFFGVYMHTSNSQVDMSWINVPCIIDDCRLHTAILACKRILFHLYCTRTCVSKVQEKATIVLL